MSRRLAILLLLLALVTCSDGGDAGPDLGLPERHARRFMPFDPRWIPESQVPKTPQFTPSMVIWEFTETLDPPGPEERRAADAWVERCYDAAKRHGWYDYEKGVADGFERPPADPRHYHHREYLLDGVVLDPERPEFLMYYPTPEGGQALAGFMFFPNEMMERGPQFAGMLTLWHYHVWAHPRCVVDEGFISLGFQQRGETCERGQAQHRSAEMIHTWLIDHPKGPFATSMHLPPDVLLPGLEKRLEERGF